MGNKYHNIKTQCLSRHLHDSRREAEYCNRLLAMRQSGEILGYEIQVPFPLPGPIIHVVDFIVKVKSGKIEVHEVKGKRTREWVMKYKLFKISYPQHEYRVIGEESKPKRRMSCPKKIMAQIYR